MKRLPACFVGLGLTVAVSSPVFADATASGSLTDLTVTVTSANGSGTPSFSWGSSAFYEEGYANPVGLSNTYGLTVTPPATNGASTAGSSASSTITGSTSPGTSYTATTSALAAGSSLSAENYAQAEAENNQYDNGQTFTLGADSKVTFSFTTSTSAITTVGFNTLTGGSEYAEAEAIFEGVFQGSDKIAGLVSTASYNDSPYSGQNSSDSQSWSVSFKNTTHSALSGYVILEAYSYCYSEVGAVPEPDTVALMASGLGLFGVVLAKRRRSTRSSAVVAFA